jgi:hypothetical protein
MANPEEAVADPELDPEALLAADAALEEALEQSLVFESHSRGVCALPSESTADGRAG